MNPILLILALLFLIPIIKELRLFILVNWYSRQVVGHIINIDKKETFTRNINTILQGGKHRLINVSYRFVFDNKEHRVFDDELLISPSSKLNKLKKDDKIDIYVYSKNDKIKNTWLFKPSFIKLVPYLILFLLLLIVAYLSADV